MSEQLHSLGAYTIRMERRGNCFVYDILKNEAIVASGFDMNSSSEAAAVQGIAERFGIADASKQFFKGEVCQHQ